MDEQTIGGAEITQSGAENKHPLEENNQPSEVARAGKRKAMKPRSKAWEHFTKFVNDAGEVKGKCNYCGKVLACDSKSNGTTSLNSHMKICKQKPPPEELVQCQLSFGADAKTGLVTWKFDQDVVRKSLACMIIMDELPFKFVEGDGFKQFMANSQPRFTIPSRWTVARDCFGIYIDEKVKLKEYLNNKKQRVCLTTDTWTSIQRINYMCVTAHFIDDSWTLRKRILNFVPIFSHKGIDIGMELEKCLLEWGIERVLTVTVDNASSNDGACQYLKEKLTKWGYSVMKCQFLHVRCVAHIVNLIVTDGLKEIGHSVRRVREAIRYIRQSATRIKNFRASCEDEQICTKKMLSLDVSTRWNSTYLMLETAQKFETAFRRYAHRDPYFKLDLEAGEGVPQIEDWNNVRRLNLMLSHFYELTLRISGSLYVTSNVFFQEIYELYRFLDEWTRNEVIELANIAEKMKQKYDKYWGDPMKMNKLLYVAVVLDPRYKLDWVQFTLSKMYRGAVSELIVVQLKEVLTSLYNEYNQGAGVSSSAQSERESVHNSQVDLHGDDNDPKLKFKKILDMEKQAYKSRRLGGKTTRTELDRYLGEEQEEETDDFDILGWWKLNSVRFPILSLIARDVLAMPISTVASESTFSTGGRVLDPFRSSLTPKIVQSLICAQDWLRHSVLYLVEEGEDDIRKIELDMQKIALEANVDIV